MAYSWIWLAILILAIVVEVLTDQLISIWFVPASIVAIILDFCNVDILWQILVFLLVAGVGIVLAKTVFAKYFKASITKTNIDAIIGERCIVTEKIDNFAGCGQVKIKGLIWSARGVDDDAIYEVGEILNVVAIEGVKVICKKQ